MREKIIKKQKKAQRERKSKTQIELIKYIQMDNNMKQCNLIFQFEFVVFQKMYFHFEFIDT